MFESATAKLDDARALVGEIGASDSLPAIRRRFAAAASAIRSIPEALTSEGKRHFRKNEPTRTKEFADWADAKRAEMRDDELLNFVISARNADLHEGRHAITFNWSITGPFVAGNDDPDRPGNSHVELGPDGPLWVVDSGTPQERRVPIVGRQGYTATAHLVSPPANHLGVPVTQDDPVSVCESALDYFATMLFEAKHRFGTTETT